jgi:hypothetical protein
MESDVRAAGGTGAVAGLACAIGEARAHRTVIIASPNVHGRFLRLEDFWPQNCATQRNAARNPFTLLARAWSCSAQRAEAIHRLKQREPGSLGNLLERIIFAILCPILLCF